jgi:hypothetical protein
MAVAPIATILTPRKHDLGNAIMAVATYTSAGATTAVTVTLANSYPPINRRIPMPILGIFCIANETAWAAGDNQNFEPSGQCDGVPDSAGEFQITGDRTFVIYNTPDKNGTLVVFYCYKGSGNVS